MLPKVSLIIRKRDDHKTWILVVVVACFCIHCFHDCSFAIKKITIPSLCCWNKIKT